MTLPKQLDNREITLQFLSEPGDVNFGGKVHGGSVMKWIDLAGYACASGWSGSYAVTVYVGGIKFMRPILIGDLVEVQAQMVYTGKTSMHITVDVYRRCPREQERYKATHCVIIFVAVDNDGNKIEVPQWQPITEQDVALQQYAIKLTKLRQSSVNEMQQHCLE